MTHHSSLAVFVVLGGLAWLLGGCSEDAAGGAPIGQNPSTDTSTQTDGGGLTPGSGGGGMWLDTDAGTTEEPNPGDEIPPVCGDLTINQVGEECDDGNRVGNDGCNGACKREPLFDCPPTGGPCTPQMVCGDSKITAIEQCDDGNNVGGDGCSARCQVEAAYYVCPNNNGVGGPCTSTVACGDGRVEAGEICDDMNNVGGDGCAADCFSVEPGWICRKPGSPCTPQCGDGSILAGFEQCDDANTDPGDGCSPTCMNEPGWDCSTGVCIQSICGNGTVEAGEACDKGAENGLFYGDPATPGCSKTCTLEPSCRTNGVTGACETFCGDANIDEGETCDDGNANPGDGCDANCQQEGGFTCTTVEEPDTEPCSTASGDCLMLPVIFRDFDGQNVTGGHPDFFYLGATVDGQKTTCVPNASGNPDTVTTNCSSTDSTDLCTGLVNPTLNALGKPEFNPTKNGMCECRFTDWDAQDILTATTGQACSVEGDGSTRYRVGFDSVLNVPVMHSAETFNQWYSPSSFSTEVRGTLELASIGANQYQFSSSDGLTVNDDIHSFCDNESSATLSSGFFPLEDQPRAKVCNIWPYWNSGLSTDCCAGPGCPVGSQWDTTVAYGTCDPGDGGALPYADGEITGMKRNFYFTTEVRYLFRYSATTAGTLSFFGDDDVWVFVNGQLALDLGGTHERLEGAVNINGATFGLEEGRIYEVAVFHADQHPRESNYQLTLSGFATAKSECEPHCGDGVATLTEQCDLGTANDDAAYGGCRTDCTWGPFCGDGVINGPEICDDGVNTTLEYGVEGCAPGCVPPPRCGNGVVEQAEQCDDGPNNQDGVEGACSTSCLINPRCGDGVVMIESGEECDLGDGNAPPDQVLYGGCTTECKLGPHCGDGVTDTPDEECDDGNFVPRDGCSPLCLKYEIAR
jgi:fibro-slime domain-containing protein